VLLFLFFQKGIHALMQSLIILEFDFIVHLQMYHECGFLTWTLYEYCKPVHSWQLDDDDEGPRGDDVLAQSLVSIVLGLSCSLVHTSHSADQTHTFRFIVSQWKHSQCCCCCKAFMVNELAGLNFCGSHVVNGTDHLRWYCCCVCYYCSHPVCLGQLSLASLRGR